MGAQKFLESKNRFCNKPDDLFIIQKDLIVELIVLIYRLDYKHNKISDFIGNFKKEWYDKDLPEILKSFSDAALEELIIRITNPNADT